MGLTRFVIQNKSFILLIVFIYILFWFMLVTFKQPTKLNEISVDDQNHPSASNFDFILEYLSTFNINLLLIDPILLNHLFILQFSFEKFPKRLITFGISNNSIPSNHPLFSIKTSIDHIFIEYNQHIIHLAILHEEKTYFLIQKNTIQLPTDVELSYGDKLRAIESSSTEVNLMNDKYLFSFPRNVSHFLWLYKTSEFLQCDQILANQMKTKYALYQNITQLNLTILPMRNIVEALNKYEKRYWLAAGTLLGWYRHCGLIPYTQDVDFGLYAEEYDENIRDYFLGNPIVHLWGALGLINDSLEFRLFTGYYTFDLFWTYREDNYRWYGFQIQRIKYRRILPLLPNLCSGDLFGYIFTIPCLPVDYLNTEYGYNKWKNPLEKNYTWVNIKYPSMWNDMSWMYAMRLYTPEGKLRTDQDAIYWIGNESNYSVETILSYRNVLPKDLGTSPSVK